MDIELLSKMVKELLLDNDVVNLPSLGSFVAEIVPATFSDGGHTINPPYRKLYFRDNIETGDDLLVKMYATENNVTEEVAADVIKGFIAEIKDLLNSRKSIVLPELGRLRATKENNYFFVPFENIDIYPEGEGLESIPLKIRSQQTEAPVEAPVVEPAPEDTEIPESIETPSEDTEIPEESVTETSEETPTEATEIPEETPATETTEIDRTSEETPEEFGDETPDETPTETAADEPSDEEPVILNGVEVVRLGGSSENPDDSDKGTPAEPATVVQNVAKPKPKSTLSKGWLRAIIIIGSILLAFALLILLFILLSHLFPAFIDGILYH